MTHAQELRFILDRLVQLYDTADRLRGLTARVARDVRHQLAGELAHQLPLVGGQLLREIERYERGEIPPE